MNLLFKNSFTFKEDDFRKYFALYLRPHENWSGVFCFSLFFAIISFYGVHMLLNVVITLCSSIFGVSKVSLNDAWNSIISEGIVFYIVAIVLATFFVIFVHLMVLSYRRTLGKEKIDWKSDKWTKRTQMAFAELHQGNTKKPAVEGTHYFPLSLWDSTRLTFYGFGIKQTKWYNRNAFFTNCEILPGLDFPKGLKEKNFVPPENLVLECEFESRFYEDRIEKGNVQHPVIFKYFDIFDIVEWCKVPEFAIIRMKDKESEIVIKKNAFDGKTWKQARQYILARKNEEKVIEEKKFENASRFDRWRQKHDLFRD